MTAIHNVGLWMGFKFVDAGNGMVANDFSFLRQK
jgi:hypothetical protein